MLATSSNPSHAIACGSDTIGDAGRLAADPAMRSTYMVSAGSALMMSASCRALVESAAPVRATRTATSGNSGTAQFIVGQALLQQAMDELAIIQRIGGIHRQRGHSVRHCPCNDRGRHDLSRTSGPI